MAIDLRAGTLSVEAFRKRKSKREKLLADLRVFTDECGTIVGWEAPAFKTGYTFPDGVVLKTEDEARSWFEERLLDGSFDWLLESKESILQEQKTKTVRRTQEGRKRRLVNAAKFRTDRDVERAIEAKQQEIESLEARQQMAVRSGGKDKLAGVIKKARNYLQELQVLRTTIRGKF